MPMKRGDLNKCVAFYVVGGIMSVLGLVLLIVSVTVKYKAYDSFAYIGGIVLLMGMSLVFLWYNFTIPYDEDKKQEGYVKPKETTKKSGEVSKDKEIPYRQETPEQAPPKSSSSQRSLARNSVAPVDEIETIEMQHQINNEPNGYVNPAYKDESESSNGVDDVQITGTQPSRTYHVNT